MSVCSLNVCVFSYSILRDHNCILSFIYLGYWSVYLFWCFEEAGCIGTMSSEPQRLTFPSVSSSSSSSPIPSPGELQSFDHLGSSCFQMPESQVLTIYSNFRICFHLEFILYYFVLKCFILLTYNCSIFPVTSWYIYIYIYIYRWIDR